MTWYMCFSSSFAARGEVARVEARPVLREVWLRLHCGCCRSSSEAKNLEGATLPANLV